MGFLKATNKEAPVASDEKDDGSVNGSYLYGNLSTGTISLSKPQFDIDLIKEILVNQFGFFILENMRGHLVRQGNLTISTQSLAYSPADNEQSIARSIVGYITSAGREPYFAFHSIDSMTHTIRYAAFYY